MLCGKAEVKSGGKIEIENSSNMFSSDMDKDFAFELAKQLAKRMDIKKVEIFFTGGFEEDSYSSAIMCGSITSMVRSLYSVLSQKYKNVKMYEDIDPTFFETNLELTFDGVVAVSILKIFISLIKANKITGESYERKTI